MRYAISDWIYDTTDERLPETVIRSLSAVQPEQKWIPCSERLPDVGSGIIFCDVDGDIFVGHRASEHWWSVDDKVKNVVAWMPLPDPYTPSKVGYHDNSEVARYGATFRQHEILDIIEGMPPAQPEPHWIPCSERLPDVGSGIIFCDVDGDIFVGHRASEHWWSVDDKVKNVVAWMPLPEPYKGGEKGIAGALAGGDA